MLTLRLSILTTVYFSQTINRILNLKKLLIAMGKIVVELRYLSGNVYFIML